jgi:hypothetical protein
MYRKNLLPILCHSDKTERCTERQNPGVLRFCLTSYKSDPRSRFTGNFTVHSSRFTAHRWTTTQPATVPTLTDCSHRFPHHDCHAPSHKSFPSLPSTCFLGSDHDPENAPSIFWSLAKRMIPVPAKEVANQILKKIHQTTRRVKIWIVLTLSTIRFTRPPHPLVTRRHNPRQSVVG